MSKAKKEKLAVIAMAVAIYARRCNDVSLEEMGRLGFDQISSKEYIRERVLEILADAYVEYYNELHSA